jgi:hypothetical protein
MHQHVANLIIHFTFIKIIIFFYLKCTHNCISKSYFSILNQSKNLGYYNSTPIKESRPRDWVMLTQKAADKIFSDLLLFPK